MASEQKTSICRSCNSFCPIDVTVEDGKVQKIVGNRRAPIYRGYSCPKGRVLPEQHNMPERLRTSLKRRPDGSFEPISSEQLIEELSERIGRLLENNGPRSIATYLSGGVIEQPAASSLMISFLKAIGSPMTFSASTIDQPGATIGYALHGRWSGGRIRPEDRDVFLIVGGNPINSKQYLPQNPGMQIKHMRGNGGRLIVIDPRKTETARLADIHIQPIPGEDPAILAGIIHLLIANDRINHEFINQNARGFDELAAAVRHFTPDYVARRAGIGAQELRDVAKVIGEANKGDVGLGTGPSMATRGLLSSYLALCINTLKGFWAKPGDDAMHSSVLLPEREFYAQPIDPYPAWGYGHKTRIKSFEETPSGMPLAALPEEILSPGEGQVKALFLHGGAIQSWPQSGKTLEALRTLDTLVIHDVVMSPTAELADYVVATKMQLEIPAITILNEIISASGHSGYGWDKPFAFAGPAVVDPPEDSDLLESWQTYYRIARKLGIELTLENWRSNASTPPSLDMKNEPSTDALYDMMCDNSAVPLDEIRQYPNGHVFQRAQKQVKPRQKECQARFQLANADMLNVLKQVGTEDFKARRKVDDQFRFLLIPSRLQNSTNTFHKSPDILKWSYNPAFMNPNDMADLQLKGGDEITIQSRHGQLKAIVEVDNGLRPGVVAMMHGFGGKPGDNIKPHRAGSNVNLLTSWDDDFEPHTGMPRMSALPISVQRVT